MFLKRHVRRKNGKDHTYWSLVKSERIGKVSRHRTLAYLGELDVVDCGGWAKLARELDDKPAPIIHPTLFDPEPDDEPVPEEVTVNVNGVRVEETTDFEEKAFLYPRGLYNNDAELFEQIDQLTQRLKYQSYDSDLK